MSDSLKDWDLKMAEKDAALTKRNARISSLEAQLRQEKARADGFSSMLAEGVKHLEKAEAALALEKEAGKVGEDMIAGLEAALAEAREQAGKWREVVGKVQAVVDDMPSNECTCGADNGDDLGSGGQETGCYLHELLAALALPATEPKPASVYENNGLEKAGIKHMGDCGQDGGCNPECRAFPTRKPTEREKAADRERSIAFGMIETESECLSSLREKDAFQHTKSIAHHLALAVKRYKDAARLDAAERGESAE